MKNINTLVADIYALLESGKAKIDTGRLAEMLSRRVGEKSGGGDTLRMSNIGEKCMRKLWYRANQPDTQAPVPGFTRLKFITGDIKEEIILSLAEQSGHEVLARGEEVTFEGVKGHVDAIIDGVVVDVKSANSRSMEKFRRNSLGRIDPFGYLDQIGLYSKALEGDPRVRITGEVAFLAADKELGHVVLDKYRTPQKPWADIIKRIKASMDSPEPPRRAYMDEPDGKSGNRQLCMECRYCDYKDECWKDANKGQGLRKYIYASGPKWLTRVMKDPNVQESFKTN